MTVGRIATVSAPLHHHCPVFGESDRQISTNPQTLPHRYPPNSPQSFAAIARFRRGGILVRAETTVNGS
jgi:hypothetical protein